MARFLMVQQAWYAGRNWFRDGRPYPAERLHALASLPLMDRRVAIWKRLKKKKRPLIDSPAPIRERHALVQKELHRQI